MKNNQEKAITKQVGNKSNSEDSVFYEPKVTNIGESGG